MADRRLLLPVLAGALFALSACPPSYPNCNNDDHCKSDGKTEVCVDGKCQECGRDGDCKKGFACKASKCVPKPECTADGECPSGQKCRSEKCTPECGADSDCPKGQQCKAGRCAPTPECSTNADCPSGKKCDGNGRCSTPSDESSSSGNGACKLEVVRFDFNDFKLTEEARKTVEKNAECIKSRKLTVTLEGHADERGTEEFNLHLGEKRANSVKKYLATFADPSKIKTVSFGKERPANNGHDEAAWAENRRVEFSER